jgi:hypothetical protein
MNGDTKQRNTEKRKKNTKAQKQVNGRYHGDCGSQATAFGVLAFFGAPAHHQIDVYPFGSGFITSSTSASHEVWPTDI